MNIGEQTIKQPLVYCATVQGGAIYVAAYSAGEARHLIRQSGFTEFYLSPVAKPLVHTTN